MLPVQNLCGFFLYLWSGPYPYCLLVKVSVINGQVVVPVLPSVAEIAMVTAGTEAPFCVCASIISQCEETRDLNQNQE